MATCLRIEVRGWKGHAPEIFILAISLFVSVVFHLDHKASEDIAG